MKLRKSKRFIYIAISCILLLSNTSTVFASQIDSTNDKTNEVQTTSEWPQAPSVTAESAIIMDASTGLVLYEKNSTETKYPASITKILTTLLAIENSSLSDTVTFSRDAVFGVDLDSSRVGIDVGEKLTMEDSLYAVMLASANEVSYAVAEHVAGSMEAFVDMMNAKAIELGCVNSNFTNPHGLHDTNHYTCAYDMALIAREAIKNTTFAKITGSRTYVIPPTNIQEESRPLANHHKFIKGDIRYEGATGGKTGYTSAAKYTLVTYAQRGDMELICVVMASDSVTSEYTDTAALLDYGFDNFSIYSISSSENEFLNEDSAFFTKYSTIFNAENTFLTTGEDGYVVLPNNANLSDAAKEIEYTELQELKEGDNVIGHVTYTYKDKIVGQTDIIYRNKDTDALPTKINTIIESSKPNPQSSDSTTKQRNLKPLIVGIIVAVIVLIILAYYFLIERPRIRRRKAYLKRRQAYKKRYDDYES